MAEKLLDRPWRVMRMCHDSYRSGQAHVHWAKRFILFLNMPHLNELGRISMSLARGQADSLTLPSGKEYNENQSHLS